MVLARQQGRAELQVGAALLQVGPGSCPAIGRNGPGSVFHHRDGKTGCQGIQRGVIHAVVARQAGHEYFRYLAAAQVVGQTGAFAVAIVKKRAIAINFHVGAFAEDDFYPGRIEGGGQLGAGIGLGAVVGPMLLKLTTKADSDSSAGTEAGICK